MKRTLLLLLAVLLLTGCAAKPQETEPSETVAPPTAPTDPTQPTAGTEPGNNGSGQQAESPVRICALPEGNYTGLHSMGSHLLIAAAEGVSVLSDDLSGIAASLKVGVEITGVDAAATGVAYYRLDTKRVFVINPQLQNVIQLQLPENIAGTPIINLAGNEVYYSTGKEIRALNIHTGISRLLRQQTAAEWELKGACFGGTVLICGQTDEKGILQQTYISAETGQTVASGEGVLKIQTHGNLFFADRMDGIVRQFVFGTSKADAKCLLLPENAGYAVALAMNGVVAYQKEGEALALSFYDLASGKRTAKTMLADVQFPDAVHCDGTYIWLLAVDGKTGKQNLYRWDITKSPVTEDAVYVDHFYTAQSPDTHGLEQCRQKADALEETFGLNIHLWTEAVQNAGSYGVTAEYQPKALMAMLENLEAAFGKFPAGFFEETIDTGRMHIALVRSIDGGITHAQFRQNGEYRIILTGAEDSVKSFYQCLAYGVDSHVLGNSRDFDTWNQLNPEGFTYAYSYDFTAQNQYLTGETRAFAEALGMSYPHEDRCLIFCHAMMENNGEIFRSEMMQAKLLRLCKGIREAYGLEKSTQTYAWEQYLNISLAYKK